MRTPGKGGEESEAVVARSCSLCGRRAEGPAGGLPHGWSWAVENERQQYHCPVCLREHIRAIEAKLPEEWW